MLFFPPKDRGNATFEFVPSQAKINNNNQEIQWK